MRALLVAVLMSLGCNLGGSVDLDVGRGDGGGDALPTEPGEDGSSDGAAGGGGSVTLELVGLEATLERLCDLDGDGIPDNALADLGATDGALMAGAMSSSLSQLTRTESTSVMLHIPWVSDLESMTGPQVSLAMMGAVLAEQSSPSGHSTCWVAPAYLDACAEPRSVFREGALDAGALAAAGGALALAEGWGESMGVHQVTLTGAVEHRGRAAELEVCGYLSVSELAQFPAFRDGEVSALEAFLGGGQQLGIPQISGMSPNVDLDGDGLETFVLDSEGSIARCVDGDYSVIEGADCWRDERMADGFGVSLALELAPARLDGLLPSWPWEATGACPPAPEESFWGRGEWSTCAPLSVAACSPDCGGEGEALCALAGDSWGPCAPVGARLVEATSCGELDLGDGVSCGGDPEAVQLTDGPGQARSVALLPELRAGRGPVVLRARARVTRGTTAAPGGAWTIDVGIGEDGGRLGLSWYFHSLAQDSDHDVIRITWNEDHVIEAHGGADVSPSLDSDTIGATNQEMQLVLLPDDASTPENETILSASVLEGDALHGWDLRCLGDACPFVLTEGDRLRVGLSAVTFENDAVIATAPLGEGALTVEVRGICP